MRKFYLSEKGYIEQESRQPECWINIEQPDDDDLDFLRSNLNVPQEFINSILDEDERPRFDREDEWLLTIIRIPDYDSHQKHSYITMPLGVITSDDVIITICRSKSKMLDEYIRVSNRKQYSADTKPDFVLSLIYFSTSYYLKFLREINNTVHASMQLLKQSVRNDDLYKMMQLQNVLVFFNTSLSGNATLVDRLNKVFVDDCDPDLLEDVEIELAQAQNTVNVYTEILDSAMDTLASVISNNVNQIMKKMTSVSIILMLPTLIASFYGMNVAVAFGSSPYAFVGIIIFSLALAVIIYLILRRINWI